MDELKSYEDWVLAKFNKCRIGTNPIEPSELVKYDGFEYDELYISIMGIIFNVSSAASLYGEGKEYGEFRGRDITKCLAEMVMGDDHMDIMGYKPTTLNHWKSLKQWMSKIAKKYPVAGYLEGYHTAEPPAVAEPVVAPMSEAFQRIIQQRFAKLHTYVDEAEKRILRKLEECEFAGFSGLEESIRTSVQSMVDTVPKSTTLGISDVLPSEPIVEARASTASSLYLRNQEFDRIKMNWFDILAQLPSIKVTDSTDVILLELKMCWQIPLQMLSAGVERLVMLDPDAEFIRKQVEAPHSETFLYFDSDIVDIPDTGEWKQYFDIVVDPGVLERVLNDGKKLAQIEQKIANIMAPSCPAIVIVQCKMAAQKLRKQLKLLSVISYAEVSGYVVLECLAANQ